MEKINKLPEKFSIMTGSYWHRNILEVIEEFSDAGFQTIEIWANTSHFNYNDAAIIKKLITLLDKKNLKVAAMHLPSKQPFAFDTNDSAENQNAVDNICAFSAVMKQLNAEILVIHPGSETGYNHILQRNTALENLKKIAEFYEKQNLKIALENPLPHHLGGMYHDFSFFMEKLNLTNVGWCFDTSHALLSRQINLFINNCFHRLMHTHLSDNLGQYDDHLIPGEGTIDFKNIYEKLFSVEYKGVINFEILTSSSSDYKNGLNNLSEIINKYIIKNFTEL